MDGLPMEVRCHILSYLIVRDVCKMALMSRSWREAVNCHLKLCTSVAFSIGQFLLYPLYSLVYYVLL